MVAPELDVRFRVFKNKGSDPNKSLKIMLFSTWGSFGRLGRLPKALMGVPKMSWVSLN